MKSFAEGYAHLCETFDHAFRSHPDLMERYVIMLDGETDKVMRAAIMRSGLRDTITHRYPMNNGRLDNDRA